MEDLCHICTYAQSHMCEWDWGGKEHLCTHVHSRESSVTHVPSGGMGEERMSSGMYALGDTHSHMFPVGDVGGEEELWHVRSGGHSLAYVPSGGWWRRGGSVPCTQWGTLTDICPQWGMMEERRSSGMYAVGDAQ